jgi:hypothetical protein
MRIRVQSGLHRGYTGLSRLGKHNTFLSCNTLSRGYNTLAPGACSNPDPSTLWYSRGPAYSTP